MRKRMLLVCLVAGVLLAPALNASAATSPDPAPAPATQSMDLRIPASGGGTLAATLTGSAPLSARPTIVEFSPYGTGTGTLDVGPAYNYLLVQMRGTGDSDGQFDAIGPKTQQDVAQALGWACSQPWSDGNLGLNGFSASAIAIYNSMHYSLPCVKAAVLKSGTIDLYRDLLVPGGVSNLIPGVGVLAGIGAPALAQGPARLQRNPESTFDAFFGLFSSGVNVLTHPTLDSFWQDRRFRGDANDLPILMIDGFFDVESRGAFQAYQALRQNGAHLLVVGGHDGSPVGTDDGVAEAGQWLDHYVRGVDNGVQTHPPVKMLLASGDREDMLAGDYVTRTASDWPAPGTTWSTLHLSGTRSGTAHSINDGSLSLDTPAKQVTQRYASLPSLFTATDPYNTAVIGGAGLNTLTNALPILSELTLAEPLALTYTTPKLSEDVLAAGPASLEVPLSSSSPGTAIWAVISDVSPDGVAHPLSVGRLNTAFPNIDESKSLKSDGVVVQPYGDFSTKHKAGPFQTRPYQVEFWPIGNRFEKGHRIRLDIVGASIASPLSIPALNSIRVGGSDGAVLHFPVLPESNLTAALSNG